MPEPKTKRVGYKNREPGGRKGETERERKTGVVRTAGHGGMNFGNKVPYDKTPKEQLEREEEHIVQKSEKGKCQIVQRDEK